MRGRWRKTIPPLTTVSSLLLVKMLWGPSLSEREDSLKELDLVSQWLIHRVEIGLIGVAVILWREWAARNLYEQEYINWYEVTPRGNDTLLLTHTHRYTCTYTHTYTHTHTHTHKCRSSRLDSSQVLQDVFVSLKSSEPDRFMHNNYSVIREWSGKDTDLPKLTLRRFRTDCNHDL